MMRQTANPSDAAAHLATRTSHPDDRHLASAAEQANAFLSAAGQRRHARQSQPPKRGI